MRNQKRLNFQRRLRGARARAKIFGTKERPRLSIFRSNKFIYVQLIDDKNQKTLLAGSTKDLINGDAKEHLSKTDRARKLGELMAEKVKKIGVSALIFDKGAYKYHGRVEAVADGFRQSGLKF